MVAAGNAGLNVTKKLQLRQCAQFPVEPLHLTYFPHTYCNNIAEALLASCAHFHLQESGCRRDPVSRAAVSVGLRPRTPPTQMIRGTGTWGGRHHPKNGDSRVQQCQYLSECWCQCFGVRRSVFECQCSRLRVLVIERRHLVTKCRYLVFIYRYPVSYTFIGSYPVLLSVSSINNHYPVSIITILYTSSVSRIDCRYP